MQATFILNEVAAGISQIAHLMISKLHENITTK